MSQLLQQKIDDFNTTFLTNMDRAYHQNYYKIDQRVIYQMERYQHYAQQHVELLKKTIQHLNAQYYKTIYYSLYRAPYQLATQNNLPLLPAECDSRTLNYSIMHRAGYQKTRQYVKRRLQNCLADITQANIQPILDVLHGTHPHFTMEQWIEHGIALAEHKARLITHVHRKLAREKKALQAEVIEKAYSDVIINSRNHDIQKYLDDALEQVKTFAFAHWVYDEFHDIPMEQKIIDKTKQMITIRPYQTCSEKTRHEATATFHWLFAAWPIVAYCETSQDLVNLFHHDERIQFNSEKSDDVKKVAFFKKYYANSILHMNAGAYVKRRFEKGYTPEDTDNLLAPYQQAFVDIMNQCLHDKSESQCLNALTMTASGEEPHMLTDMYTQAPALQHTAHAFMALQQNYPLIYQAYADKVMEGENEVVSQGISMDDLRPIVHEYPFNQGWYIRQHAQEFANLLPYLAYPTLKMQDHLKNVRLMHGTHIELPKALHAFSDTDRLQHFQTSLKRSLQIYQQQSANSLSETTQALRYPHQRLSCEQERAISYELIELEKSTLRFMPFMHHLLHQFNRSRSAFDEMIQSLCHP